MNINSPLNQLLRKICFFAISLLPSVGIAGSPLINHQAGRLKISFRLLFCTSLINHNIQKKNIFHVANNNRINTNVGLIVNLHISANPSNNTSPEYRAIQAYRRRDYTTMVSIIRSTKDFDVTKRFLKLYGRNLLYYIFTNSPSKYHPIVEYEGLYIISLWASQNASLGDAFYFGKFLTDIFHKKIDKLPIHEEKKKLAQFIKEKDLKEIENKFTKIIPDHAILFDGAHIMYGMHFESLSETEKEAIRESEDYIFKDFTLENILESNDYSE